MSTVKRFVYVVGPAGRRVHMVYKSRYEPVEGDKTACGQILTTSWTKAGIGHRLMKRYCLKCERANV